MPFRRRSRGRGGRRPRTPREWSRACFDIENEDLSTNVNFSSLCDNLILAAVICFNQGNQVAQPTVGVLDRVYTVDNLRLDYWETWRIVVGNAATQRYLFATKHFVSLEGEGLVNADIAGGQSLEQFQDNGPDVLDSWLNVTQIDIGSIHSNQIEGNHFRNIRSRRKVAADKQIVWRIFGGNFYGNTALSAGLIYAMQGTVSTLFHESR